MTIGVRTAKGGRRDGKLDCRCGTLCRALESLELGAALLVVEQDDSDFGLLAEVGDLSPPDVSVSVQSVHGWSIVLEHRDERATEVPLTRC